MKQLLVLGLFLAGLSQTLFGWTKITNLTDTDLLVTLQVNPEESTLLDESTETNKRRVLAPLETVISHQWDTRGKKVRRARLIVEPAKKGLRKTLIFDDNYLSLSHGNIAFEIFDQDGLPGFRAIIIDLGKKIIIG